MFLAFAVNSAIDVLLRSHLEFWALLDPRRNMAIRRSGA